MEVHSIYVLKAGDDFTARVHDQTDCCSTILCHPCVEGSLLPAGCAPAAFKLRITKYISLVDPAVATVVDVRGYGLLVGKGHRSVSAQVHVAQGQFAMCRRGSALMLIRESNSGGPTPLFKVRD